LAAALKEQGMEIVTGVKVLEIGDHGQGVRVRLQGKGGQRSIHAEHFLHARRRPYFERLDLASAGVRADPDGIPVDERMRTSGPDVLAIGDVTGGPMYSHRASAMGMAAAEDLFDHDRSPWRRIMPRAFYTIPQVASVGLTERQAKQGGHKVAVASIPYQGNAKAALMHETQGAVKVVAEAGSGEILGIHIVGPHATELISEGMLAMELKATVEDLAGAVRLHPTLSESQVDAAREVLGRGVYLLR
jgi:dihydrolipoamide dehydrogenase